MSIVAGLTHRLFGLLRLSWRELAMESSTLKLAMLTASNVATVVHVRRPNGSAVANISIPAGSRRAALNLHGISGVVVVSILREKALIQATRITITR
jgi:hypothetical protein